MQKNIQTHLVRKKSTLPVLCLNCDESIKPNELYYIEEGLTEHIHSLLARKFCVDCYTKYGEKFLLNMINE